MALTKVPLSMADTSAGVGYQTGDGGAVTQATSKSTSVTLNKLCGQITMNAAALASSTSVSFILTNSFIGINDNVICTVVNDVNSIAYNVWAGAAGGAAQINVRNISAGSLSEAVKINFAVIKSTVA